MADSFCLPAAPLPGLHTATAGVNKQALSIFLDARQGKYRLSEDGGLRLVNFLAVLAPKDLKFIQKVTERLKITEALHDALPDISHVHILTHTKDRASELLAFVSKTAPPEADVSTAPISVACITSVLIGIVTRPCFLKVSYCCNEVAWDSLFMMLIYCC